MKCRICKCDYPYLDLRFPYCRTTTECIKAGDKFKEEQREKKWRKRTVPVKNKKPKVKKLQTLINEFQEVFNLFIRLRDKGNPCISCGQMNTLQAGHYFAVKGYKGLRFDEFNVHGEAACCNLFNESHLILYGINLIKKIGEVEYDALLERAAQYKNGTLENDYYYKGKWQRDGIERGIEIYTQKVKELS